MASQWVGVIGTAIGAGIGGVVTVVSLTVKGHQDKTAERRRVEREDRLREDDRNRAERQEHVSDPRQLYARLLKAVDETTKSLFRVGVQMGVAPRNSIRWRLGHKTSLRIKVAEPLLEHFDYLNDLAGQAELLAHDRAVVDEVQAFLDDTNQWISGVIMGTIQMNDLDRLRDAHNRLKERQPRLRDACRRELGLDPAAEDLP